MGEISQELSTINPEDIPRGSVSLHQKLEQFNENVTYDVVVDEKVVGLTILNINLEEPSVIIELFELEEKYRGKRLGVGYYQGLIGYLITTYPNLQVIESVPTDKAAMVKVRHGVKLPEGWTRYYSKTLLETDSVNKLKTIPKTQIESLGDLAINSQNGDIPGITEDLQEALGYIQPGFGVRQVIERKRDT